MWRKISLNFYINNAFGVRRYMPKAGKVNPFKRPKSIQGKFVVIPKKDDHMHRDQLKVLRSSQNYDGDPEGFEDTESDFMNVHHTSEEHEAEEKQYKEQVRHWTVKNKYFKEKLPNFLTYAQKEQIKMLNSRDSDEWTPEKLSESFPADPFTISKVLKANWSARSEKRIKLHDEAVMKNWNLFKNGKITNLSRDLLEHLQKFANRTLEDLKGTELQKIVLPQLPKPKSTEYSSIITSCKKYKENSQTLETKEISRDMLEVKRIGSVHAGGNESFKKGKIFDKTKLRFEDLKQQKLIPCEEENNPSPIEKSEVADVPRCAEEYPLKNPEKAEIIISQEDMKTYEVTPLKEKIYIPRKLWKRGATYKVEDCYYDYDGEFLYRVPGMTGKVV